MIAVTATSGGHEEVETISLFPSPEPTTPVLSKLYSHPDYRATSRPVRWTAYKAKADCDECFAVQHENRGAGWPRNPARWRRQTHGAPDLRDLLLCGAHQELWKARDAK